MPIFPGSKHTYLVVFVATVVGFLTGTALSWSSPVLVKLKYMNNLEENPLGRLITKEEESWIGSLLPLGAILGALIFGILVEKIGRKMTGLMVALPYMTSFLILAFAETDSLFYVGRTLMGISLGGVYCYLPIYIVEIVEDANRGLLLAVKTTSVTAGFLLSYCIGPYVTIMIFNLISALICLFYLAVYWILAPESPFYLVLHGRDEEAAEALFRLRRRTEQEIQLELKKIKFTTEQTREGSLLDIILVKSTRRAFIYLLVIIVLQQFTGIMAVNAYTQVIFESAGSSIRSDISAVILGIVQAAVGSASSPFLEKLGRRTMLLIALTGVIISDASLGAYFFLYENNRDVSAITWLPLVALVLFMIAFSGGTASIPWTLMGELLRTDIRPKASIIITSCYFLMSFLIVKYFPILSADIGTAIPFWIFAGCTIIFEMFVYCFIFETKGKSLQEIQTILSR